MTSKATVERPKIFQEASVAVDKLNMQCLASIHHQNRRQRECIAMWLVGLVNPGVHAGRVEECGETALVVFNSAEHNTRETRPKGTALLYHHVSQAGAHLWCSLTLRFDILLTC